MQYDNAPEHRTRIVAKWLDEKEVERLKLSSFSLDLSPIKHILDETVKRLKNEKPKNETELRQALVRVWHSIHNNVIKKLMDSVLNRFNKIIRSNSYPTR